MDKLNVHNRFPFRASVDARIWEEAWNWLRDEHGYPGREASVWVYMEKKSGKAVYNFKYEKDRNWFILRWG